MIPWSIEGRMGFTVMEKNNENILKAVFASGAMAFLTALANNDPLPPSKVPHKVGKSPKLKKLQKDKKRAKARQRKGKK